ncbi:acyl-CoA dehydrogenase family protein [soil metagenome]
MRPETDPQRMLADAARQFATRRNDSARVRACRDRTPGIDPDVWADMAELGWLAMLAAEADGGMAASLSDMGQLVYRWGASCAPEPLVATAVLAVRLLTLGDGPARNQLLSSTMNGTAMPALAWLDAGARCEREQAGWSISGTARYVVPADASHLLLVFPAGTGAPCLALPASTAGLSIERERRVDGSAALQIAFEGLQVSDGAAVCSGESAAQAAEQARDSALVMAAVEMTGLMSTLNALTVDYLNTRVQFGKPIGSFQALQHKAVDMHIAEQLARDVAQAACAVMDGEPTIAERACAASRAKARACRSVDTIARMAVQLHGAIGFTDEYDLSLYVNRALVLSAWLGNADEHVARYARHAPPFEAAYA